MEMVLLSAEILSRAMSPTFVILPSVTLNEVTVVAPAPRVPVVDRFSSPKEIDPPESVIDPSARVRVPIEEPERLPQKPSRKLLFLPHP